MTKLQRLWRNWPTSVRIGYVLVSMLMIWTVADSNYRILFAVSAFGQFLLVLLGVWDWLWRGLAGPLRRFWLVQNNHLIPWLERKTTLLILLAPVTLLVLGYFDLTYSETPGLYSFLIPIGGAILILVGIWLFVGEFLTWGRLRQKRRGERKTYVLRGD